MTARISDQSHLAAQAPGVNTPKGIAYGLLAAGIGALYLVYARWGVERGLNAADLTALRFGVAGALTLPVLLSMWHRDPAAFTAQWKTWLLVSLLAGTPFGLVMFGALQFAPTSHATVFPFAAMSVMGMLLGAAVLGERISARKGMAIALVVVGLLLVSGLQRSSFAGSLLGDAMFIAAGTLWAGFGIVLKRHRLDPLLATSVIAFSALVSYLPAYLVLTGAQGLSSAQSHVLWLEVLVQGLIAGCGTLFTYARAVSLLGAGRAAVFPALAPGLAALLAWPILNHAPSSRELLGIVVVIAGLAWAVTSPSKPVDIQH
ncbi:MULTISPECIES: DMT family transporter [unclassified Variovorax]|uniref:DMT family transporter n=1 Tax=unclassified Variovorax TaxID=663243 RepID=UPI003ECEC25E